MAERIVLTDISSAAWEHPADRAALNALRAIPGFDQVVRKVASFFGERGVRQLFLANAVRVGPNQRPKLWAQYQEVLATLDWKEVPELYSGLLGILGVDTTGAGLPDVPAMRKIA